MKALALAPKHNSEGKRDATGAFIPEARKWLKFHDSADFVSIDNHASKRKQREQVLQAINDHADFDALGIFCHGWKRGIQFGFKNRHVAELAEAIAYAAPANVVVLLYCCSTASGDGAGGDGGFADRLRDELVTEHGAHDCVVMGHDTVGHTTKNPYVRMFDGSESLTGGRWAINPGSALWKVWKRELRNSKTLRFAFPHMDREMLREFLLART